LIRPLPRPAFENIESVLRSIESGPENEDGLPAGLKDLDRDLAKAALLDVRVLLECVLSCLGSRRTEGAHGYRTRLVLTCVGWVAVRHAYIRAGASAFLAALGVVARSTAAARDRTVRCAVLCGSFAEGRNMLACLCGIAISVSKLRALALGHGEHCLREQDMAAADVRTYPAYKPKDGETETVRTLFCMLDGTGSPCTKADTAGIKGKNGQAGTRQIRVAVFGEYQWLDKKGRPLPFRGSFSYAVSGDTISQASVLVRRLGLARGYGKVIRMQCVADGEEALEKALRDAFPDAIFTNDFMHACDHLHACCEQLEPDPQALAKEYRFLKGLLYRIGAASVIKRIERRHAPALEKSGEAKKQLDYLRKREPNMRYGKLRKAGLFIASGHVEAAARVIVVRRCKQAGMHWRHENAIRISAILANLRSAA